MRSGLNLTEERAPLIDRIVLLLVVAGTLTADAIAAQVGTNRRYRPPNHRTASPASSRRRQQAGPVHCREGPLMGRRKCPARVSCSVEQDACPVAVLLRRWLCVKLSCSLSCSCPATTNRTHPFIGVSWLSCSRPFGFDGGTRPLALKESVRVAMRQLPITSAFGIAFCPFSGRRTLTTPSTIRARCDTRTLRAVLFGPGPSAEFARA